jgi:hypothetical protein
MLHGIIESHSITNSRKNTVKEKRGGGLAGAAAAERIY